MAKKAALEYTPEFWARAIELAIKSPKFCEQCIRKNGADISRGENPKHKTILEVRVALRKPDVLDRTNLGLFCTKCRRGKYEVKAKRSDIEALIYPLFLIPEAKA